jgi:hypothetical protein
MWPPDFIQEFLHASPRSWNIFTDSSMNSIQVFNCVREKWKCFSFIFYWKSSYFLFVHNFIYALSSCLAGNTSSVWYFKRMFFSYCTIVLNLLPTHLEFLCKCPRVYSPICSYSFMFKGLGKQFFWSWII